MEGTAVSEKPEVGLQEVGSRAWLSFGEHWGMRRRGPSPLWALRRPRKDLGLPKNKALEGRSRCCPGRPCEGRLSRVVTKGWGPTSACAASFCADRAQGPEVAREGGRGAREQIVEMVGSP